MVELKFKYDVLLYIVISLSCFIPISIQQAYDDGDGSLLDDVPPIWICNGTDLKTRSYDGTCNNLVHTNWGAINRVFDRGFFDPYYDDYFTGSPVSLIDTRLISNLLADSGQPPSFTGNPLGDDILTTTRKTVFETFFGQFINHDLEEAATQSDVPGFVIADTSADPVFNNQSNNMWNPTQSPYMTITLSLGRIINSTLYPVNKGNSYLDLSNIYGNNDDDAMKLRTRENGMMSLSNYVTNGGVYNKAILNTTVANMAPSPQETDIFPNLSAPQINVLDAMVSGDTRASENIQLAIIHTIWIREHNFQAQKILQENPDLAGKDEEIYQRARRITIAEYQHVVFDEYLPAAIGFRMPQYAGYDENIYVDTTTYFSTAAFRYGHSNVRPYNIVDGCTGELVALHPDYESTSSHPNRFFYVGRSIGVDPPPNSGLTREQLDYTPARMIALASGTGNGVDNIVTSMLREPTAEFDIMFSNALRHMPGIIDLFAIDIARGRLNGLQPYNVYRTAYHPAGDVYNNRACDINAAEDPVECFSVITSNATLASNLQYLYKKVNFIDAIVGMFAEDKQASTSPLPPTITNILREEFEKKRMGDRFWYEGKEFTAQEIAAIKAVTMKQIIERNTNVINVQVNPFKNPGANETPPSVGNCGKGKDPEPKVPAKGKDPEAAKVPAKAKDPGPAKGPAKGKTPTPS
ncbi:7987_t:CDS:2 [Funneliformis caledonium]|uniref:7987_t:CDS:1 n=1 Tax=Funneliformis caledonium TaxID=1117310 RepID=A0A9N8YPP3_9GLOM|nr:7987_t:CDS:2 [Funneliformis caledonium]